MKRARVRLSLKSNKNGERNEEKYRVTEEVLCEEPLPGGQAWLSDGSVVTEKLGQTIHCYGFILQVDHKMGEVGGRGLRGVCFVTSSLVLVSSLFACKELPVGMCRMEEN